MEKYVIAVKDRLSGKFYGYIKAGINDIVCDASKATKYDDLDKVMYDIDDVCLQFPDYVCIYQEFDTNSKVLEGYQLSCVVNGETKWLSKGGRLIKNNKSAYTFKSINPMQVYIMRLRSSRNARDFKINVVE